MVFPLLAGLLPSVIAAGGSVVGGKLLGNAVIQASEHLSHSLDGTVTRAAATTSEAFIQHGRLAKESATIVGASVVAVADSITQLSGSITHLSNTAQVGVNNIAAEMRGLKQSIDAFILLWPGQINQVVLTALSEVRSIGDRWLDRVERMWTLTMLALFFALLVFMFWNKEESPGLISEATRSLITYVTDNQSWCALLTLVVAATVFGMHRLRVQHLGQVTRELRVAMQIAASDQQIDARILASAERSVPSGSIVAFAGSIANIPAGYLVCDGTSQNALTHADLYAAIGTVWGSAEAGWFNLPDLRGAFLRGADLGSGRDPEAATRTPNHNDSVDVGSHQVHSFAQHNHSAVDSGHTHGLASSNPLAYAVNPGAANAFFFHMNNDGTTLHGAANIVVGNSGAVETRPSNFAVTFIIKI